MLRQAVCAGVEQRLEEFLARTCNICSTATAEESGIFRERLEEEQAARLKLGEEADGLRDKIIELEKSVAVAREAASHAKGQDTARREALEAYVARLDEERFERKRVEAQLKDAREEVAAASFPPRTPLRFPV